MKAVVTSQGIDVCCQVDTHFDTAKYFLLVDTDSGEITACISNQQLDNAPDAGIEAGQDIVSLGAEIVITGGVGPRALATLQGRGVDVYIGANGTVSGRGPGTVRTEQT